MGGRHGRTVLHAAVFSWKKHATHLFHYFLSNFSTHVSHPIVFHHHHYQRRQHQGEQFLCRWNLGLTLSLDVMGFQRWLTFTIIIIMMMIMTWAKVTQDDNDPWKSECFPVRLSICSIMGPCGRRESCEGNWFFEDHQFFVYLDKFSRRRAQHEIFVWFSPA